MRRFHIEACLGRGGFGEVYRARMTRPSGFEVDVAVKLLRPDVAVEGQAARRLRDEARMLGLVRHRAIPKVHDLVEIEGRLALVSEYVEGADLSRCLKVTPPPGPRAMAEVCGTVADALDAAWHARVPGRDQPARIVHRDLKPANIRIAREGVPMLLDFGIAWTDAVTRIASTQTSALVGSPAYMAPERFDGMAPTPANDLFSLGAVLWEGLTGRRLFADLRFKELAAVCLFEERFVRVLEQRLSEVPRELPGRLHDLVASLLAWAPEGRPTAAEAARELEELADELPGPTLRAWCRDRTWPSDTGLDGPWVGRVVCEAPSGPDEGAGAVTPVVSPLPPVAPIAAESTSDDLFLQSVDPETASLETVSVEALEATAAEVLPPPRSSWPRRAGAVALGAVALVLASWLGTLLPRGALDAPPAATGPIQAEPVASTAAPEEPASDERPQALEIAAPEPEPAPEAPKPAESARRRTASSTQATPPPVAARPEAPEAQPPPPAPARVTLPKVEELLDDAEERVTASAVSARVPPPRPTAPRPEPAPTAPPPTTWVGVDPVSQVAAVRLLGPEGRYQLPARVPPGSYRVEAEFDPGIPRVIGTVAVALGDPVELRCANLICRPNR